MNYPVNLLAVLLSGVAYMAIGMLWYSPLLFAKQWMELMGITPKKIEQMKNSSNLSLTYALSFAGSLVEAFMIGYILHLTGMEGAANGVVVAVLCWLGFVTVTQLSHNMYNNKPLKLYFLDTTYHLVAIIVMGAIMGGLQ